MIDSKMKSDELPNWFIDLLIHRATDCLDEDQQRQFDRFVEEHPDCDWVKSKAEKYELAAAAIELNYQRVDSQSIAELPSDLREKLRSSARQYFRDGNESAAANSTPPASPDSAQRVVMTSREAWAWMAAAAAVVLLMTGLNPFAGPSPSNQGPEFATSAASIEQRFAEFNNAPIKDRVTLRWTATVADSQATGSVVWSDARQQGFMTFIGLAANDPTESQYQLWIFDTDAGQPHPVDGGVFNIVGDGGAIDIAGDGEVLDIAGDGEALDIAGDGQVIISIDARIPVTKAVMFAITEERPGGVVVSDRKRLPLLAKVDS